MPGISAIFMELLYRPDFVWYIQRFGLAREGSIVWYTEFSQLCAPWLCRVYAINRLTGRHVLIIFYVQDQAFNKYVQRYDDVHGKNEVVALYESDGADTVD